MDSATAASSEKRRLGQKIKEAFSGKVERTAIIEVEPEHPDIGGLAVYSAAQGYDPYFLLTEFETIRSHAVLSKAIDSLKLKDEWAKKYNGGQPLTDARAEELLKGKLDLHNVRNTKKIEIGVESASADEAARIANAVAQAYRDYCAEEFADLKNQGIKSLQQQIQQQDKQIELAQAKVDQLAKELNNSGTAAGVPVLPAQNDSALPKPTIPPPVPQPEVLTRENAVSTFSLNVSDVSFKLAAASLEKGQMPEPASIRSEEFINAFNYRDPDARDGAAIAFASERARYPFAQNRELLRFSLKTAAAGRQAGRPLNIVLLLDNSGSMERADRVKIIQEALRVLAGQLQASDTFSIVTFARTAQLRVDGIPGNRAAAAAEEIAKLTPEGGTNLGDALALAYETARHHYLANGDNRVVLLTDGAANLGDVHADTLKQKVEAQRQQGIALDCFGIGWEGYNDDLLEVLTRNGDGRYGFINTPEAATTEFAAQIAGALHVAASDVKVQVEFNPKRVTSYRQIGYAKHQLTKEQFRDNTVDAAEIAAQEAGNALYTVEVNAEGEGSIATVRVRYKVPGTAEYREQAWDVPYTGGAAALDQASPAMRLAATASAFSEWLATSPFAAEVSTDQMLRYLSGVPQVYGADARPAKLEWMIRQARSISGK
jgi:secreted protein with Ig-like and vWFA domain